MNLIWETYKVHYVLVEDVDQPVDQLVSQPVDQRVSQLVGL